MWCKAATGLDFMHVLNFLAVCHSFHQCTCMCQFATLHLEGYRKFDFMQLCTHAVPSGECSYYLDVTGYHHAQIMQDFTLFINDSLMEHIFSPSVRSSIVHSCNSYILV